MGGQWVAELATVGVTHLGTAPPLVVGIGHCVYAVFRVFAVHVVLCWPLTSGVAGRSLHCEAKAVEGLG
jgi:hypothetical protein